MPPTPHQPGPSAEDVARRVVILKYVALYARRSPVRHMLRMFLALPDVKRDDFWQPLREANLWPDLSSAEREFAGTTMATMTPQQRIDASWRLESAQILIWSLGLLPQIPPYDVKANHTLLKQIPSSDLAHFVSSAQLRKRSEIDHARADAELWHWRSRTRRLMEEGADFPADEQTRAAGLHSYNDVVRVTANRLNKEGRIRAINEDFPAKGKAYRELSAAEWSEVQSITSERHLALNWLSGYAPGNEWDKTPTDT